MQETAELRDLCLYIEKIRAVIGKWYWEIIFINWKYHPACNFSDAKCPFGIFGAEAAWSGLKY